VKRGEHGAPTCKHGRWTFARSDFKRNAAKWRCPSGECDPMSIWVEAERRYPLIPRETRRFRDLYAGAAPPWNGSSGASSMSTGCLLSGFADLSGLRFTLT
jgi:hypothetical protein